MDPGLGVAVAAVFFVISVCVTGVAVWLNSLRVNDLHRDLLRRVDHVQRQLNKIEDAMLERRLQALSDSKPFARTSSIAGPLDRARPGDN